jgi:hypothetical protein
MNSDQQLVLINLCLLFLLKVTCFVLGYGIVKIGAELLREGVRGEFKFKTSMGSAKADLVSASPGLLFLVLGVVLIAFAMWVHKVIPFRSEEETAAGSSSSFVPVLPPKTGSLPSGEPK